MDAIFAFKGKDFVLVGSDTSNKHSIFVLNEGDNKLIDLDRLGSKIMGVVGDNLGDVTAFSEYIRQSIRLQELQLDQPLSATATARFVRRELATAVRKNPFAVNTLIAGFDDTTPSVHWLDYLGTLATVDFAAQGYCGFFLLSLFDAHWKPEMSEEEAVALAADALKEMQRRFAIRNPRFIVKVLRPNQASTTRIIGTDNDAYMTPA